MAAYLLARGLDGKSPNQRDVARLDPADEVVRSTRTTFSVGRGNVDADIFRSHFQSEICASAARTLHRDRIDSRIHDDESANYYALCAMTGKVFGAGVCDNYAATAAFSYGAAAQQLAHPPAEEVHLVMHKQQKHVWAEVGPSDAQESSVVVDPWADGSAVFAEDSRFASRRTRLSTNASLSLSDAADLNHWTDAHSQMIRSDEDDIATRLDQARQEVLGTSGGAFKRWRPQPVLGDQFLARTQDRLRTNDPWKVVQTEVLATGVARLLDVHRVPDLLSEAPKIVEETKALVERGIEAGRSRR